MSTIKSSNEHLTFNADGSGKEVRFQANGTQKASISSAGAFTSTTIDATVLTGNLPALNGAALTGVAPTKSTVEALGIDVPAANLTGTVADARFPSTLPAASAANLTAIPAANITGTLPAISGANLTGVSAGKLLQVVEHTVTAGSRNSVNYGDLYSVNITPSATSSKILVMAVVGGLYMNLSSETNQTSWRLARTITGGSEVAPTGHNTNFQTEVGRNNTGAGSRAYINMTVLDEPSTTTATKYAVQCRRINGSGGISICDTAGTSTIVCMEIEG